MPTLRIARTRLTFSAVSPLQIAPDPEERLVSVRSRGTRRERTTVETFAAEASQTVILMPKGFKIVVLGPREHLK